MRKLAAAFQKRQFLFRVDGMADWQNANTNPTSTIFGKVRRGCFH
jgi:hypothetical protein